MTTQPTNLLDHERFARAFHETYERLAPSFSYQTREDSRKPWSDVPQNNKNLMVAVCAEVIDDLTDKLQRAEQAIALAAETIAHNEKALERAERMEEALRLSVRKCKRCDGAGKYQTVVTGYTNDILAYRYDCEHCAMARAALEER